MRRIRGVFILSEETEYLVLIDFFLAMMILNNSTNQTGTQTQKNSTYQAGNNQLPSNSASQGNAVLFIDVRGTWVSKVVGRVKEDKDIGGQRGKGPGYRSQRRRGRRKVTSGFWNVNGWSTVKDRDNFIFRSECVQFLNVDILGVAETHLCLLNNDIIELPGFVLFGNYRKS
jgi:hypothetical protein